MIVDLGEQIRNQVMKEINARKNLKRVDTLIFIAAIVSILVLITYSSLFFLFNWNYSILMWVGMYLFMSSLLAWGILYVYVYIKFIKKSIKEGI
ncbi:hypothetical protein ig2599ANME_1023 [groundwater metagenome]